MTLETDEESHRCHLVALSRTTRDTAVQAHRRSHGGGVGQHERAVATTSTAFCIVGRCNCSSCAGVHHDQVSAVSFILGVALAGVACGMSWLLNGSGYFFGTTNMGAKMMFYDGVTSAIGTLVLSNLVA